MLKKNKIAGATKKSPPLKLAVKKTTAPAAAKKLETPAPAAIPAMIVSAPSGKRYIAINEPDPQLQKKYRLIIIIVVVAAIFLIISCFFPCAITSAKPSTASARASLKKK